MSSELQASIEGRVANTLETITAEVFSNRIGMVRASGGNDAQISEMMTAMPGDLMYVFRVVEMMRGLLHLLGGTESDRLSIMTTAAVKWARRER